MIVHTEFRDTVTLEGEGRKEGRSPARRSGGPHLDCAHSDEPPYLLRNDRRAVRIDPAYLERNTADPGRSVDPHRVDQAVLLRDKAKHAAQHLRAVFGSDRKPRPARLPSGTGHSDFHTCDDQHTITRHLSQTLA